MTTEAERKLQRVIRSAEKLAGDRGPKTGYGVTRSQLKLSANLTSSQITAAPTQADFNKLQADVAAIFATLTKLQNA